MNTKKLIALILALCLSMSLAACGNSEQTGNTTSGSLGTNNSDGTSSDDAVIANAPVETTEGNVDVSLTNGKLTEQSDIVGDAVDVIGNVESKFVFGMAKKTVDIIDDTTGEIVELNSTGSISGDNKVSPGLSSSKISLIGSKSAIGAAVSISAKSNFANSSATKTEVKSVTKKESNNNNVKTVWGYDELPQAVKDYYSEEYWTWDSEANTFKFKFDTKSKSEFMSKYGMDAFLFDDYKIYNPETGEYIINYGAKSLTGSAMSITWLYDQATAAENPTEDQKKIIEIVNSDSKLKAEVIASQEKSEKQAAEAKAKKDALSQAKGFASYEDEMQQRQDCIAWKLGFDSAEELDAYYAEHGVYNLPFDIHDEEAAKARRTPEQQAKIDEYNKKFWASTLEYYGFDTLDEYLAWSNEIKEKYPYQTDSQESARNKRAAEVAKANRNKTTKSATGETIASLAQLEAEYEAGKTAMWSSAEWDYFEMVYPSKSAWEHRNDDKQSSSTGTTTDGSGSTTSGSTDTSEITWVDRTPSSSVRPLAELEAEYAANPQNEFKWSLEERKYFDSIYPTDYSWEHRNDNKQSSSTSTTTESSGSTTSGSTDTSGTSTDTSASTDTGTSTDTSSSGSTSTTETTTTPSTETTTQSETTTPSSDTPAPASETPASSETATTSEETTAG